MNQLIIAGMRLMNTAHGLCQVHVSIIAEQQLANYRRPHLKTPHSNAVVAPGFQITDYMDLDELNMTLIFIFLCEIKSFLGLIWLEGEEFNFYMVKCISKN